jgi:hypothetical protein
MSGEVLKPKQGDLYLAANGRKYFVEEMSEWEDEGESYFQIVLVEEGYEDSFDAPSEEVMDHEWESYVRIHKLKKIEN